MVAASGATVTASVAADGEGVAPPTVGVTTLGAGVTTLGAGVAPSVAFAAAERSGRRKQQQQQAARSTRRTQGKSGRERRLQDLKGRGPLGPKESCWGGRRRHTVAGVNGDVGAFFEAVAKRGLDFNDGCW